jgi:hypothetical protein
MVSASFSIVAGSWSDWAAANSDVIRMNNRVVWLATINGNSINSLFGVAATFSYCLRTNRRISSKTRKVPRKIPAAINHRPVVLPKYSDSNKPSSSLMVIDEAGTTRANDRQGWQADEAPKEVEPMNVPSP